MMNTTKNILMIDDDNDDYLFVQNMLAQSTGNKYLVIWADNYDTGLKEVLSDHYDAVLVDYDLGTRTGLELIRAAKAQDYPSPFILYTGRGNYSVDVEAMEAGATMYLSKKETNPLLLERTIRYAIELKHKEKQLRELNGQLAQEMLVRKRAEERIHAEQAWFRITLASIGDAVITTDPQGLITSLNSVAEKLTGWTNEEALGQPMGLVFSIINEVTGKKIEDPVGEVLRSGLVVGLAERTALVTRDGTVIPVEDSAAPIQNGDREILGVVMVCRDVTEKRKIERELANYSDRLSRSNQELEQFAIVASHDLQEPLRKVIKFGELLQEQLGSSLSAEQQDTLDRMTSAADRMSDMISDLLDLSRVNSQGGKFEETDLGEAANDAVANLESRIITAQGQVIIDPLPTIEADPLQIRLLLQNLIGNAIKYHKPGVPALVRVSSQAGPDLPGIEQTIILQVEDNGIGFDPSQAQAIFQPFKRLHGRGAYEGTGIGLAICQKIVLRHHGSISAHSQPGEGSSITVTLPVRQM